MTPVIVLLKHLIASKDSVRVMYYLFLVKRIKIVSVKRSVGLEDVFHFNGLNVFYPYVGRFLIC